jgi:hypothetical protein
MEEGIREAVKTLSVAVAKVRCQPWYSRIPRWAPVGIGAISGILGMAENKVVGGLGVGLSVALEVYQELQAAEPEGPAHEVSRLLARLQADVFDASIVRRLAT